METTPANLFSRLRRDDRNAMNELFEQYYVPLCRFACSYVALSEAEELVSDVFVGVWRARKTISIESSVRAYFYASVRYACYRVISARKLNTLSLDELEDVVDVAASRGPDDDIIFKETQSFVSAVVQQLPPRCRQVFIMNRYDGLSYKEIAEIMGISEKTVENQLVKALQVIRANLLQYEKA
ncbi:RNA polymerase sigma-70 factor [Chryseolinea sp. T2]|uniref:RNA polymerase sigma-70 factor n=1 Tax=Chryseolinea sp. T2 TaxID=3129255 RepID=UPI0030776923